VIKAGNMTIDNPITQVKKLIAAIKRELASLDVDLVDFKLGVHEEDGVAVLRFAVSRDLFTDDEQKEFNEAFKDIVANFTLEEENQQATTKDTKDIKDWFLS